MKGSIVWEKRNGIKRSVKVPVMDRAQYQFYCELNEVYFFREAQREGAASAEIDKLGKHLKRELAWFARQLLRSGELSYTEYRDEMVYIFSAFDRELQFESCEDEVTERVMEE